MNFLTSYSIFPLLSINNIYNSYRYLNSLPSYMQIVWVNFAFKEKAIEGPTQTKLNNFVTQLGFDSTEIQFIVFPRETKDPYHFQSKSAIQVGKPNRIYLPEKAIDEIDKELTPIHKFILGHEISHLISNGSVEHLKKMAVVGKLEIIAYSITFLALTLFLPFDAFDPTALMLKHQLSLILSYNVGVAIGNRISQRNELSHDHWSASQSKEMALGGIQLFEKIELENDQKKKEVMEKEKSDHLIKRVTRRVTGLFNSIFFPVSFCSHPPERVRIAAINKLIANEGDASAHPPVDSSLIGRVIRLLTPHSSFISNLR
jgi:hypothetical protein